MESSKLAQDVHSFDWDDSDLIKAYEKGMRIKEKTLGKANRSATAKESYKPVKKQKFRVGSYCRALYPKDMLYYEAKILSVEEDYCNIEFLGYGDTLEVNIKDLKDSFGKKSRKKQIKKAKDGYSEYSTADSETCGDTTDEASDNYSRRKKPQHCQQDVYDYSTAESTFHAPYNVAPPPMPSTLQHVPQNPPFLPYPPAPPMPQCPTGNSSVSAMLVSWYMAGYYTGLHQAQKPSQCGQRCCNHSNQCCHH